MIDAGLRTQINCCVTGRQPWPLLIYGSVGTGKTVAAILLCVTVGRGCLYRTLSGRCEELADAMRGQCFNEVRNREVTVSELRCWWRESPLTVLDEIGGRSPSDFQCETLQRSVDDRDGRPCVFISNHGPDVIADMFDDRVASRLCCGTVVQVCGEDRRQAK